MKKVGRQISSAFILLWVLSVFAFAVSLIPVGRTVGIEIATQGAVIVQLSAVSDGNKEYYPASESGLQKGDVIYSLDNQEVTSNVDLQEILSSCNGKSMKLSYLRNNEKHETKIQPIKTSEGTYRIGILVRDSLAGIGTITYVDPQNGSYASLGHGICDSDTEALIPIQSGYITPSSVTSVQKGKSGEPGELEGNLEYQTKIGSIIKNTNSGIFGVFESNSYYKGLKPLEVAQAKEVKTGDVKILANIEGNKTNEYSAEIVQLYPDNDKEGRSFMLKITDPELIAKTGGIVQGMSGSPIIQNDKLIGAVTHVLVNDPTKGYGIFVEKMLKESNKVNKNS